MAWDSKKVKEMKDKIRNPIDQILRKTLVSQTASIVTKEDTILNIVTLGMEPMFLNLMRSYFGFLKL